MILKPINSKAGFSYNVGSKTKNVTLPLTTVLDIDLDKETVVVRNFWFGNAEKWMADSDSEIIRLSSGQLDRLVNSRNFVVLDDWKPISE